MKTDFMKKNLTVGWILSSVILVLTTQTLAQTDNPCGAPSLTPGSTCVNQTGSYPSSSTGTTGVPAPGCANYPVGGDDVWYQVTVPASGQLTIDLNTSPGGPTDMAMAWYSAPSCSGPFTLIECDDDDSNNGAMPRINRTGLTAGSIIYVRIWEYGANSFGNFQICATSATTAACIGGQNNNCATADPFCTGTAYNYCNTTGVASAGAYNCLLSTPNPMWMYLNIATSGNIDIQIQQFNNAGTGIDVDFALYGPYSSVAAGCATITGSTTPVDCSYSTAFTETANITGAVAGQFYLLLITNYNGSAGYIQFSQTGGSGTTNCTIVNPCDITSLTATPTNCNASNQYSVSGSLSFIDQPTTGTLTVSSSCGGSQTFNAPFTSPINYNLTGLTPNGSTCTVTATFSATVCSETATYTSPAIPVVNSGADAVICNGGSTPLTASGASTYTWSPTTALSPTTGPSVTANPTATTTYTVTGTSAAGCTATDAVQVTVNPVATVNAGPDQTICSGSTATLAGSFGGGATSATWSAPSGSFSSTSSMTAVYTPTITSGSVTLTLTTNDPAGPCPFVTDQVVINVNPRPTVTVNSPSVCAGSLATVTATPTPAGTYSYAWTVPGGATNPGNVATFSTTVAGTYSVVITNTTTGCTSLSASGTVTVNPLPTVNAGTDQTVCQGTNVTLAATGASTYSWDNGVTQGGSFTPAVGSTTYTVTGTSTAGCINTDQVVITVNPTPLVNAGPDVTVCVGGTATLTATGASTYSWSTGATTASINVSPASTTTYTVTGTSLGCAATDAVTITVSGAAAINAGLDVAICEGQSTTLTATGGVTYNWNNGLGAGNGFSVSPASTTTYTVTGTDAGGCIGSDAVTVTVNPLPAVNAGLDQTVCAGTAVTLAATGAATYTWDNGVTNGEAFTPTGTLTYTVTGTTAAGCIATDQVVVTVNPLPVVDAGTDFAVCSNGSATLSATGGAVYTWNNGVINGVSFVPVATNTYTVSGTDANGCINTDQITVSVLTNAPVNAGPDAAICIGQSTTLAATGAVTFNWDQGLGTGNSFTVSPTGTTTYTVVGTDGNGCTGTDAIIVTVNPLPTLNAGADQTVCQGTSVTLTATGASTYSWDNGVSNGVSFTPAVGTITYSVSGTSAAGCIASDQVVVTVNPLPTTDAGLDQTVCAGTAVTLTATGAASYSWSGGVNQGISFSPTATATYTVTGTSASGCTTIDVVTVTVNPLPTTNAGPDQTVCDGTAVTLTATGAATYSWDNGVINGIAFTPAVGTITYTVTGTSAAGCITSDQVLVTVNPNPVPVIQGPTEYCSGFSATLSTTVPYTAYDWSTGVTTPTINATIANNPISVTVTNGFGCQATSGTYTVVENSVITANFTETICQGESVLIHGVMQSLAGTYSETYVSASGCDSVANVTLIVNPLPAVNAGVDQAVCSGTSTVLNASGAINYAWDNGVTQGVPFAQGIGSTVYTVSGTDLNGCINTDEVTITVNPLPLVGAGIDQALCIGGAVTLNGSGASSYVWNNGVTDGVAFNPSVTTSYTVTGTDINGCINTDQVTVTVNPLPTVSAGTDLTTCTGGSVTLTGSGATNYSWDNGITNGVAFTPDATGTYTVSGTDANGCVNTDQVLVTVAGLPPVNAGLDQVVCAGTSVTLSGSGAATYTWNNGITNSVPFTPAVGTVTFTVTGTDGGGCINTDQVTVTVNPLPVVNAGPDQAICIGGSATLAGSGASTYNWNNGVINNTPFNPVLTSSYTVTGTDANGCINTDQAVVTVNPLPNVGAGPDQTVCVGSAVTLSGSGATVYSWDNGVTNGLAFTPAPGSVTYIVTGTDGNGCINTDQVVVNVNALPVVNAGTDQTVCQGTQVTLSASGASTYSWSPVITNGTPFTPIVGTTSYTVSGTDANGCVNTDQVNVTVHPTPIVTAGADQVLCIGESVTLTASGASSYLWNNGVSDGVAFVPSIGTETYSVTGTSEFGCTATDEVIVIVNPLPNVFAGNDLTICEGESLTLTGSGAVNYTWDNGVLNGIGFTPSVGAFTYTLTGTSAAGCINTDQIDVTVNPLPLVSFTPGATSGCTPFTTTLTNSSPDSQNCVWTISNGTVLTGCGTVPVTFNQGGCYDVTLTTTSILGCTASLSADNLICVEDDPVADFIPSSNILSTLNTEVYFENLSTGATQYSWNLGVDGAVSNEENPIYSYPDNVEGQYVVTLVATSPLGCADTASAIIQVYEELLFYVPNTFTPDRDNYNPVFQPVFTSGFDPQDYVLYIFNRWGELIFESRNAEIGWDGSYGTWDQSQNQVDLVQDGVYTWKIEFKVTRTDERKMYVGHVNLIR